MKCSAAGFILWVVFAGCHAPQPSLNLLAPYGSARVPPPPTNSAGARLSQPEGTPGSPTAVAPGMQRVPSVPTSRPATAQTSPYLASDGSWISIQQKLGSDSEPLRTPSRAGRTGDVRLSSFEENLPPVEARAPSRGTATLEWETPLIRSVPVPTPPRKFHPEEGVTAISGAAAAPEAVRTVSATAQSSDPQPSTSSAERHEADEPGRADGTSTLEWREPR